MMLVTKLLRLVLLQGIYEQSIAKDGDAVKNASFGPESTVPGSHLKLATITRKPVNFHIVGVKNVRGSVFTHRDVIAKRVGRRSW